jgi:hypothetical protein
MAELKTQKTRQSVTTFLNSIEDEVKRKDSKRLAQMMGSATGAKASMWGSSIVGYGKKTITYANGKQSEWFQVGFSPRKQSLVLYIMDGFTGHKALLKKLGKHKTGKACLYVKRLEDVDVEVLEALIQASVDAQS